MSEKTEIPCKLCLVKVFCKQLQFIKCDRLYLWLLHQEDNYESKTIIRNELGNKRVWITLSPNVEMTDDLVCKIMKKQTELQEIKRKENLLWKEGRQAKEKFHATCVSC